MTQNKNIRKIFDEYYIHIPRLRQLLNAKADFTSNRALFRYLTQILDARVLDLISMSPPRYLDTPVSLNFNIETVLSKKFQEFDTLIKPFAKFTVVVEIQIGDVFTDISAFMAARNTLNNMGYKICLDGLTNLSIVQIDREKLGFDFVKLQWNADLEDDLGATENRRLMSTVQSFGHNRVILCRCDTAQAVNYGQAMGINMFQGRLIDNLLNPNQKIDN
jgi:EAL domain-containing protein (putative c-di-GMP-specific phosphodiesterase class I)